MILIVLYDSKVDFALGLIQRGDLTFLNFLHRSHFFEGHDALRAHSFIVCSEDPSFCFLSWVMVRVCDVGGGACEVSARPVPLEEVFVSSRTNLETVVNKTIIAFSNICDAISAATVPHLGHVTSSSAIVALLWSGENPLI